MRLSSLLTPAEGATLHGEDKQIKGLSLDSRTVERDYVYIAISGVQSDGAQFIGQAIKNGACAIVAESSVKRADVPENVTLVTVENARAALSFAASRFYPRQPQQVAAITGTSGKTSTVQFTSQLWALAGHKAASLGTLGLIAPETKHYYGLTTPDSITMHKMIDKICGQGVTHLAMEASSHGVELNRLDALNVNVAAFTNLSRDHLDYHETMEKYLDAKLRLFTDLLSADGTAVLNADIDEYEKIAAVCKKRGIKILSYGKKGEDIRLISFAPEANGQRMIVEVMGKTHEFILPVIGSFQVENSMCALALTIASGEDPDTMVDHMTRLNGVPGRLEYIGKSKAGGSVFVDYAHKPSALDNVLTALRPHVEAVGAKLHVIVGCGGDRDKGKRPIMAKLSQDLADYVIITDDNPRTEDPSTIRAEMMAGCNKEDPNLREIGDRATAIQEAVKALGKDDVLVIAGKGHEDGQLIGDKVLPFNDATEARKAIAV